MSPEELASRARERHLTVEDSGFGWVDIKGGPVSVRYYETKGTVFIPSLGRALTAKYTAQQALDIASGHMPKLAPIDRQGRIDKTSWRKRKKRMLLKRDPRCTYCGCGLDMTTGTLDHIIPLIRGGTNSDTNLCLACSKCNHDKGNKVRHELPHVRKIGQISGPALASEEGGE